MAMARLLGHLRPAALRPVNGFVFRSAWRTGAGSRLLGVTKRSFAGEPLPPKVKERLQELIGRVSTLKDAPHLSPSGKMSLENAIVRAKRVEEKDEVDPVDVAKVEQVVDASLAAVSKFQSGEGIQVAQGVLDIGGAVAFFVPPPFGETIGLLLGTVSGILGFFGEEQQTVDTIMRGIISKAQFEVIEADCAEIMQQVQYFQLACTSGEVAAYEHKLLPQWDDWWQTVAGFLNNTYYANLSARFHDYEPSSMADLHNGRMQAAVFAMYMNMTNMLMVLFRRVFALAYSCGKADDLRVVNAYRIYQEIRRHTASFSEELAEPCTVGRSPTLFAYKCRQDYAPLENVRSALGCPTLSVPNFDAYIENDKSMRWYNNGSERITVTDSWNSCTQMKCVPHEHYPGCHYIQVNDKYDTLFMQDDGHVKRGATRDATNTQQMFVSVKAKGPSPFYYISAREYIVNQEWPCTKALYVFTNIFNASWLDDTTTDKGADCHWQYQEL